MALRVWSDGGLREGSAGTGWIIKGAWTFDDVERDMWEDIAWVALELGSCTITVAELVGIMEAVSAIDSLLRKGRVQFTEHHRVLSVSRPAKEEAVAAWDSVSAPRAPTVVCPPCMPAVRRVAYADASCTSCGLEMFECDCASSEAVSASTEQTTLCVMKRTQC